MKRITLSRAVSDELLGILPEKPGRRRVPHGRLGVDVALEGDDGAAGLGLGDLHAALAGDG